MKFIRRRAERVVVIGFFESRETGSTAWKNLRRAGFRRSAAVQCSGAGEVRVEEFGISAERGAVGMALIGLLLGMLSPLPRLIMEYAGAISGMALSLAACGLAGGLAGWWIFRWLDTRVGAAHLAKARRLLVHNETLVITEAPARETARVVAGLCALEGEAPVTFAFHALSDFDFEPEANLLRNDAPSSQGLAEKAVRLAHSLTTAPGATSRVQSLLLRLKETERVLKWTDASLSLSVDVHHAFTLSAEWLLDNAYLIQGQINEIRQSLPKAYYKLLPVVEGGPQAGLPRVYRIATEIVAESDGALDVDTIRTFLGAFQSVSPLNIGELWAVPLMLRLRLVECLRSISLQVERLQRESEEAAFWANRLITAVRRSPERLVELMAELVRQHPEPTAHFASELVAHLYDEEAALPMVNVWLDRSLRAPMIEVVQQEHRRQAIQQSSLANIITSCRRLTQIQWQELFETVSLVDFEFSEGSRRHIRAGRFSDTRPVPQCGRGDCPWSKTPESEVISRVIALAGTAEEGIARHVGYHLIDEGRQPLERQAGCSVPLAEWLRRSLRRHATGFYLGSLCALTAALASLPLAVAGASGTGLAMLCVLGFLLLLPASELAVQVVNWIVTVLLPPRALPKMSFKKEGIPDDCRTWSWCQCC